MAANVRLGHIGVPAQNPRQLAAFYHDLLGKVDSLAALKAVYAEAKAHGITIDRVLNHRASLSMYLHDPEGNGIEIYWPTGQTVEDLFAEPVDIAQLEQPDSALLELIFSTRDGVHTGRQAAAT